MDYFKWATPSLKQTWCASSIIIGVMGQGMIMGHTSCLLLGLNSPDSLIKTDIHSASWLVAGPGLAVLVGIILSCILLDVCGRRRASLLSLLPGIVGWIMVYLAQTYAVLLIGRILMSATSGGFVTVAQVVLAEYTSPQNRGMFLTLKTAAITLGAALSHILGFYMHWRDIALVALIPNIIALLIICTLPESPTWLATRKRFEKCVQDFFWLRGTNKKSEKEVNELIKAQRVRLSQPTNKHIKKDNLFESLRKFTRKDFLRPLFTVIISFILMEASGRHYFPTYALQIMDDALNLKFMPYYYTLCIDLVIIVSGILSSVLIRIMNRRTLLFSTGIASLIILVCKCSYLFLISNNMVSKGHPWVITFIFIVYFFVVNLGCSPIPITLLGELFPVAYRESGPAILLSLSCLMLLGYLKVTPYLLSALKVHGTFAIYGVIMAVSLIVLYFILPETKDKTLQEIENYFNHGEFSDVEENDEVELKMISDDQQ